MICNIIDKNFMKVSWKHRLEYFGNLKKAYNITFRDAPKLFNGF